MKQHLFVLLIVTGVLPRVHLVPRTYILIQQGKTWNDAQAYCRATYTDLATINTNDDMVQLQNEVQKHQFNSSAWIGLYTNINSWSWSFENQPLGEFTNWTNTNPDNAGGNDQCVYIWVSSWGDERCESALAFLCFDDTKTGSDSYILISQRKTWNDTQSYCRQYYTDLASARNATENSIIGGINPDYGTWFGLNRTPWKWSDQNSDVSFITWSPGNMDDYLQNKSCGYLSNNLANEAQCSDIMPFFCYTLPKQHLIMRVKVKSSQDVNDSAVMAPILEKIQKKLKDYELSVGITVKWREQPDGVVFHRENENNTEF